MEKSDLKNGMLVELRNNEVLMYIENRFVDEAGYIELKDYSDELLCEKAEYDLMANDIMKIFKPLEIIHLHDLKGSKKELLWERKKEVDWSKVSVDTKILVRDNVGDYWQKRYFANYMGGNVYAWNKGATSWSTTCSTYWEYAKLYEEQND